MLCTEATNTRNIRNRRRELDKEPELKARVMRFRGDNFRLQNQADKDELFQVAEQLNRESASLRQNLKVNAYLDAELALCRLMQRICRTLVAGIDIQIPDLLGGRKTMADTRDKAGRAGVFLAGGAFKIALYICILVFLIWVGKSAYQFGYDVFNQQAMSPGEGSAGNCSHKEGASAYKVGKTLEQKGLIKDAAAFVVQERMSAYHGQIKAGTYLLSTAYTPTRIIAVLSGEESEEGSNSQ